MLLRIGITPPLPHSCLHFMLQNSSRALMRPSLAVLMLTSQDSTASVRELPKHNKKRYKSMPRCIVLSEFITPDRLSLDLDK